MSLRGQTALVTGAGKRIGEAVALALGEAGVNIVTHYRQSAGRAEGLRDLLRRRGVQAFCIQADFEKLDEVDSLIDRARAEAGPIDILVNNASEFRAETIEALTHASFQRDLDINAWTPFALTRAFARQASQGKVINFLDAQIAGYDRAHAGYILSKHLLATLTRMTALQYAPGLTVNAVAPGLILPPEGKDESYLLQLAKGVPLQRHGGLVDITRTVLFLLESEFVTGQVVFVDGGQHLAGGDRWTGS